MYPVKSFAAISLDQATLGSHGLAYDRQWMVVDSKGMFLTQRKTPNMALIQPQLEGRYLTLTHRDEPTEPVKTPLAGPEGEELLTAQIWQDTVQVKSCATTVNEWLSDHLGVYCKLVYLPAQNARPLAEQYGKAGEATLLSDSCPLLIVGEASLQDLNERLAEPVPMSRFRPNLVFSGGTAFEEDHWKTFWIAESPFRGIRKCTRCRIVNIDQATAQVYQNPLNALAEYRRDAQGICFGLHATLKLRYESVTVRRGDQVVAG